ncbi:MAG: hypothetical protein A3B68_08465 [Candidatus Melainabacteria bacterium RIFCSPHIGHO2_02_FULL_34_12]|nr:MAG: hypothetical protein A3B68_08465 [Candidatus Melainabacteria bacterium RIFCSPHIGHO2_02_FULL_34_12]
MKSNIKKATFTLPTDLILYLQTKENQAAFVTDAIKKAKEEEERKKLKKAVKEMSESKEIWNELEDWDVTLED